MNSRQSLRIVHYSLLIAHCSALSLPPSTTILEGCPSGRRSTPGKCVWLKRSSWVRIPPPQQKARFLVGNGLFHALMFWAARAWPGLPGRCRGRLARQHSVRSFNERMYSLRSDIAANGVGDWLVLARCLVRRRLLRAFSMPTPGTSRAKGRHQRSNRGKEVTIANGVSSEWRCLYLIH